MTLQELRTKADPILVTFWNALKTRQEAYFTKNGKYFQLLISPTSIVTDGADSDFSTRSPEDERWPADVDFSFFSKIPFQIEVHEWVGGTSGYTAIVSAVVGGKLYQRTRNSQNEDSGWFINPTYT